jgi:hypothetical protein
MQPAASAAAPGACEDACYNDELAGCAEKATFGTANKRCCDEVAQGGCAAAPRLAKSRGLLQDGSAACYSACNPAPPPLAPPSPPPPSCETTCYDRDYEGCTARELARAAFGASTTCCDAIPLGGCAEQPGRRRGLLDQGTGGSDCYEYCTPPV